MREENVHNYRNCARGPLSSWSHAHAHEGERISCTTSLRFLYSLPCRLPSTRAVSPCRSVMVAHSNGLHGALLCIVPKRVPNVLGCPRFGGKPHDVRAFGAFPRTLLSRTIPSRSYR
jgi:hypothetical protein